MICFSLTILEPFVELASSDKVAGGTSQVHFHIFKWSTSLPRCVLGHKIHDSGRCIVRPHSLYIHYPGSTPDLQSILYVKGLKQPYTPDSRLHEASSRTIKRIFLHYSLQRSKGGRRPWSLWQANWQRRGRYKRFALQPRKSQITIHKTSSIIEAPSSAQI